MTWHDFFVAAAQFAPLATATVAFGAGTIALLAIRAQRDIARRRASIDFFLKTEMDQTLIELYSRFIAIAPSIAEHPSLSDFSKTKECQEVRAFLNICELIAVGIIQGAFSERVSLAYWGDTLPNAYKDTLRLIQHVRNAPGGGSDLTYIGLESICERWTNKRQIPARPRLLQLLGIIFAMLAAGLGFWDILLPPLASDSYWQLTAAVLSALISACFGLAAMRGLKEVSA